MFLLMDSATNAGNDRVLFNSSSSTTRKFNLFNNALKASSGVGLGLEGVLAVSEGIGGGDGGLGMNGEDSALQASN